MTAGGEREEGVADDPGGGHDGENVGMVESIALAVVGFTAGDGFEKAWQVVRIHLAVTGHDHSDVHPEGRERGGSR